MTLRRAKPFWVRVKGIASFDNTVQSIYIQPDGKILAGGNFTTCNGESRIRIARLNSNGSLDTSFTVTTGFDNSVRKIILQSDNKILVGGSFTTYNGVIRRYLVRLNSNGSMDTLFNVSTGIANFRSGTVIALNVQSDSKILAGGGFNSYNGNGVGNFMRINSDASFDINFLGMSSFLYDTIPLNDGKILITGNLGITRRNSDGTLDISFDGGTHSLGAGYGFTLSVQTDNKIIIGGEFQNYKGSPVPASIIRLNPDSSIDTTFNVGTEGFKDNINPADIRSIVLQPDGKLIVGGFFTQYRGQSMYNITRLNPDGSIDNTFNVGTGFSNPSIASGVFSIKLQSDGKIVVGGSFTEYNGKSTPRIARLRPDGSLDSFG